MPTTPSTSPAVPHVVLVTADLANQGLHVERESLEINSGDLVVWDFTYLPDGWRPALRFEDDDRQGLGPFAVLRQTASQVWGQGSDGTQQLRSYQAVILPPEGDSSPVQESQVATVRIQGDVNSSPVVVVTPNFSTGTFEVNLEEVTRMGGDSVVFQFAELSEDQVPSIHFHTETLQGSETPQSSGHLGPFSAFCRDVDTIAAEGSNGLIGRFEYNVVVAKMQGGTWRERKFYRSPDPFVYSEEDPVDPNLIV